MPDETLVGLIRAMAERRYDDMDAIMPKVGAVPTVAAMSALFTIAVQRKFAAGTTRAGVRDFVTRIRQYYPNGHRVSQVKAEAFLRSELGEDENILEGIPLDDAGEIQAFIGIAILDELKLNEIQLDAFVAEAAQFAQEVIDENRADRTDEA
jgi:hypothetical protein